MKEKEDLPLHDEAEARSKWRGGETILAKGRDGTDLPASEVDNAASPDGGDAAGQGFSAGAGADRLPPD